MIQANRAVNVYSGYVKETPNLFPDPKRMTNDWVRVISGFFHISWAIYQVQGVRNVDRRPAQSKPMKAYPSVSSQVNFPSRKTQCSD